MYLAYWEMTRRPFENGTQPDFLVRLESASAASRKLQYVLTAELGAAALIGPPGGGKTLLMQSIYRDLAESGWAAAYMTNALATADDFFTALSTALGAPPADDSTAPLAWLEKCLCAHAQTKREVCVLVDDVQTVRDSAILEGLRQLLDQQHQGRRVLNLILIGQEGMDERLQSASNLQSHLAMRVELSPMVEAETKQYVLTRLKIAGCKRGIFTRHAAERVHVLSQGLARNVNRLCELCLITGFGLGVNKIGPEIVDAAARDLGLREGCSFFARETTRLSRTQAEATLQSARAPATPAPSSSPPSSAAANKPAAPPPASPPVAPAPRPAAPVAASAPHDILAGL